MGCLVAIFAGAFPRVAAIILWLARPLLFEAAFGGSWLWPVLGIIFLPLTTLFYVILWSPAGIVGWDWFWLVLAVFLDVAGHAGNAYANRDRMPGYSSAPATSATPAPDTPPPATSAPPATPPPATPPPATPPPAS